MLQNEIVAILRCPNNHTPLTAATEVVVDQLNSAIRGRQIVNRAGKRLNAQIDGGFVRADGKWLYPVVDRIPVLLWDEAISLDQLAGRGIG